MPSNAPRGSDAVTVTKTYGNAPHDRRTEQRTDDQRSQDREHVNGEATLLVTVVGKLFRHRVERGLPVCHKHSLDQGLEVSRAEPRG